MGFVMTDQSGDVPDLLRRAAGGDQPACDALFDRYRDRLKRMVHLRLSRRLQGRVDDSDVLQEAYLDVSRRLAEYAADPKLPFYLWLRHLTGLKLAEVRGTIEPPRIAELVSDLRSIPHKLADLIEPADVRAEAIAAQFFAQSDFCLYLGRHVGLPVCLEGSLKLKEISYIAADAYAAGEMKHGPIALLSERTPVVAVATDAPVLDKVLSNVAEVKARGAHVIAVATEGSTEVEDTVDAVFWVPRTDWLLQPILAIVPLQLLAYRVARARGLNIDQPRNLAKTVTVE